jgi:hypothetical protein
MQRCLVVVFALRHQVPVLLVHLDAPRQVRFQLAFRPLHGHHVPLDTDFHFLGDGDWFSSNSRHIEIL